MNLHKLSLNMLLRVFTIFLTVFLLSQNGYAGSLSEESILNSWSKIISKSVRAKEKGFNKEDTLIFEGDVRLDTRNELLAFYGDKMILGLKKDRQISYFQMLGNVRMEKGTVRVSSQQAYSNKGNSYVDFWGEVAFSINGSPITVNKVRYNFVSQIFIFY